MSSILLGLVIFYFVGVVFNLYITGILIHEDNKLKDAYRENDSVVMFTILKLSLMSWGVYIREIFFRIKED